METVTEHKQLKKDEFIKIVQITGPVVDRLSVTGQVVNVNKEFFEVQTFDGIMGLSLTNDDYKFEISKLKRKPSGWDKFMKDPSKFHETEKDAAPVVNKRVQVFKIVKNNPRKKLDSLLKQAQEEVGGDASVLKKYVEMGIIKFRGA
jgi:hypothetical protein